MKQISRRSFLNLTATTAAGMLAAACTSLPLSQPTPIASPLPIAPSTRAVPPEGAAAPSRAATASSAFTPDVELALTAAAGEATIRQGGATRVWSYRAEVLKGSPDTVRTMEGSYLGPILRLYQGQKVRVRFQNELPEPSIVHWHGLLTPDRMDGHPRTAIGPGESYTYEFEVTNRAGTYWFHPHPHGLTGRQVMAGLAGLILVSDTEEAAAGLPSGEFDVPLVIQDRTFDSDNQFVYLSGQAVGGMMGMMGGTTAPGGMMGGMMGGAMGPGMMERMMGFLGDTILVNSVPDFQLTLAAAPYRLRLLNGSNSRIYKLAWSDRSPMIAIATDGGLLPAPSEHPYITLGPGERVELWADFSARAVGDEFTLESLEFAGAEGDALMGGGMGHMGHGGMGGMGGMMMSEAALANGSAFPVMTVRIDRQVRSSLTLPASLSSIERLAPTNRDKPRSFGLQFRNMSWLLSGRSFQMEDVAPDEVIRLNDVEAWEFINELNPGQMMEQWGMAHPMHINGVQFQVLGREVHAPELRTASESVREGYVDSGWKDTVLLMPGEKVRLAMRFVHEGLFLYHCHNLEHEDQGMMRNYRVDL